MHYNGQYNSKGDTEQNLQREVNNAALFSFFLQSVLPIKASLWEAIYKCLSSFSADSLTANMGKKTSTQKSATKVAHKFSARSIALTQFAVSRNVGLRYPREM